jgi:hypothetical protein
MRTKLEVLAALCFVALNNCALSQNAGHWLANVQTNFLFRAPLVDVQPSPENQLGNWGGAVDGLQVSVWLARTQFNQGSPVEIVICCRNVNTTVREMRVLEYPFEYVLRHGTNIFTLNRPTVIHQDPDNLGGTYFHRFELAPKSERVSNIPLDQLFDFSQQGDYSLQVRLPQRLPNNQWTNVVSGVAAFTILNDKR